MNVKPTYCFLINCSSNVSHAGVFFKRKEQELKRKLPGSNFIYIQKEDSIPEIAKRESSIYSHIVACGGDGTVNKTANGIIGTSAILGVLPLGSGNDFAQNIGLTLDFDTDLKLLIRDHITNIDVIESGCGYFLNTFGIGVDGLTNYYAAKSRFNKGSLRYFSGGLRALWSSESFPVTVGDLSDYKGIKEQKVWMVAIANGKTEGGKYTISPDSVNNDGQIELILVKDVSRMRLFIEFIKLSVGLSFNDDVVDIQSSTDGFQIDLKNSKIKAHADGEQQGLISGLNHFRLSKAALPVVTNHLL